MATFAFTDADVTINAVDLSDHVRQVTINYEAEALEDTAMGASARGRIAGLIDWSMEVEFNQDFAAAEVDATLFALVGAAAFAIAVRPTSAVVGATNPEYQGNCILTSYPPLGGAVGDLAVTTARFEGDGPLTRAVA